MAGWGENGALEAIQQVAELIDTIASRIEETITGKRSGPHKPDPRPGLTHEYGPRDRRPHDR